MISKAHHSPPSLDLWSLARARRGGGSRASGAGEGLWGFYPFIPYATAYILICFTMASRPFERVGDRWSRSPMRSMK